MGYEILIDSIESAQRYWKNEVDYVVIYNNLNVKWLSYLKSKLKNTQIIKADESCLPFSPVGVAWKYYPPRIRINSHELFIDNDLILLKRSKYIDDFLNDDCTLYNEDYGRGFGNLEHLIKKEFPEYKTGINSGLFGFPPDYDISDCILKHANNWNSHFNEQGLTAYLVLKYKKSLKIPMPVIYNHNFNDYELATYGNKYHEFVYEDKNFLDGIDGFH